MALTSSPTCSDKYSRISSGRGASIRSSSPVKGCRKCMLEYAKLQQTQKPETWLQTMLQLGRNLTESDPLQLILAKQWASCMDTNILRQIASSNPDTALDEMMEAYLQVTRLLKSVFDNRSESKDIDNMSSTIKLLGNLSAVKETLKSLIVSSASYLSGCNTN